MALDKELALNIAHRKATKYKHSDDEQFIFNAMHMNDLAQAIYELGVQSERERAAKVCETISYETADDIAEAIRKG